MLNRTCYISKHLKPFVAKHYRLVAKVMEKVQATSQWEEDCKDSPAFVAGYLGSMLLKRIE